MENESAAKIAIRGKGSVKEGKGKSDAAHASNQDEDLHCLIMADTEDKVNKAKQLIHNVIETVSIRRVSIRSSLTKLTWNRPLPFPKVKTNSSETNCASLPPSTVPYVTMRTKLARTVVRSAIASTTALRLATLQPTSSVVFVATLDIWHATVPTAREAPIGAICLLVALLV